jgi:hypothetical protein
MRRNPRQFKIAVASLVGILVLAACNCAPILRYITIGPTNPTIGVGTTQQFTATGYYSNGANTPGISVSWSSSNTNVATINATSGVATGVAVGTTTITATTAGVSAPGATLTINLSGPLAITTTSLPSAAYNTPYSGTISATGGAPPYTFSLDEASSPLPAGLTLTTHNNQGLISGTPTTAGTFTNIIVDVHDSATPTATVSKTYPLTITATAIVISPTSLPNGSVSTSYSENITATGGVPPYTYSMDAASTALPANLQFTSTSTTATISGIPASVGTTSNIIIDVKDSEQPAVTQKITYSITITAVAASLSISTTSPLTGATLGSSYSENVTATGGVTPYTWTLATGSILPAGLTLVSGTPSATISGTPTATGTFPFTLQVADSTSPTPQTSSVSFLVTITGSSTLNCPATVNLTLCGTYALGLRGFTSGIGPISGGIVFVANDSGNIISGTKEINQPGATPTAITITGGSYQMDSSGDGRGVVSLIDSTGAGTTYRFALESSANAGPAPAEEFDSSGTLAAGVLVGPYTPPVPQLPANLILALQLEGINGSGQRAGLLGEFQIGSSGCNGTTGSFNSMAGEPVVSNTVGTLNSSLTVTGSCTASDPNTGIGTAQITISGGTPFADSTLNFIYVTIGSLTTVNGVFFLETDAIAANQPVLNGLALGVTVPTGGFNATSLGCPCILYQGGLTNGTTTSGHSVANVIRLLTTPGTGASGTLTGIEDENSGGTITLNSAIGPYNYTVDANGVGTISASPTIHFIISETGIVTLDESVSVLAGSFRPQNATSLASTGVPYIVGMGNGDLEGVNPNVAQAVGVVTPSGATSGTLTGTVDVVSSTGPVVGVTVSGTYTIDSTTGRGTGNANFSGGPSSVATVLYVRRVREFIILDVQSTDPYLLGARLQ